MSLTGAINSAATGLSTTQTMSRVAADNVANAMTPNYVRRQAVLITPDAGRGGAVVSEIRREVNSSLTRMTRLENGKMARHQAIQEGLRAYTAFLGQPGDGSSPADKFTAFQTSLTTLANNPSSNGAQSATILAAEDLARSVREAATTLATTTSEVDMEMRYEVADLNQSIYRIAELNELTRNYEPGSMENIAFEDELEGILDSVAQIIDVRVSRTADGIVSVYTIGGAALVEGDLVQDVTYNPGDGTLMAGAQDITPFKDGVRGAEHGSLTGLSELKRDILPRFRLQLDEYARGLMQSFEASDASLAPGQAGLFTDNGAAFDTLNAEGLAARLHVNEQVAVTGDAEIWRIRDGMEATAPGPASASAQITAFMDGLNMAVGADTASDIPASVSVKDFAAEFVTSQAAERFRAENRFNSAASAAEVVTAARRNFEGVNIDDEMQQLLLIERSYAANSRVLSTVSEMIDQLIAIV